MRYGTIIRYFPDKKFGFIRPDDGRDIFFHISALETAGKHPEIKLGQPVKYELTPRGEVVPRPRPADGQPRAATDRSEQPKAKLVTLIDKLPGGKLDDSKDTEKPTRHRRARQKKPTWRR